MYTRQLPTGHKLMPALFMDLDGTVQRSKSGATFIAGPDDVELIPGVEEQIMFYHNKGFLVVGVSNQGGVACGYKTLQGMKEEHNKLRALFAVDPFEMLHSAVAWEKGAVEPFCHRTLMRKPQIGLLVMAEYMATKQNIVIDWDNSLMVGDRDEDRQCAENAGIRFMQATDFLVPHPITINF